MGTKIFLIMFSQTTQLSLLVGLMLEKLSLHNQGIFIGGESDLRRTASDYWSSEDKDILKVVKFPTKERTFFPKAEIFCDYEYSKCKREIRIKEHTEKICCFLGFLRNLI